MKRLMGKWFYHITSFMIVKVVLQYLRSGDNKPWRDRHKSFVTLNQQIATETKSETHRVRV